MYLFETKIVLIGYFWAGILKAIVIFEISSLIFFYLHSFSLCGSNI